MSIIQAIILAIVEGLTEFLPVSSTGHMIITSSLMGIAADDFTKVFEVAIQLGAILAVVVMYFKKFIRSFGFYMTLFAGFIPSVIAGLLIKDYVDALMENVTVVAITLLVGGVFLLFVDRIFQKNETLPDNDKVTPMKGFIIGIFQCIAMIPGVSRSAASIVGGLSLRLNRKTAAEFSFFLAVPTMAAATAKSIWDKKEVVMAADPLLLIVGNVVAFIVALLAIRFFINYLTRHGFRVFGIYRIVLGLTLLVLQWMHIQLTIL